MNRSIKSLPKFPYLKDSEIRDLNYNTFKIILEYFNASAEEISALKGKRKKMKKTLWKQNHDRTLRAEDGELEAAVRRLVQERSDLSRLRDSIIEEIEQYKHLMVDGKESSSV